jgi:hypothetical protein
MVLGLMQYTDTLHVAGPFPMARTEPSPARHGESAKLNDFDPRALPATSANFCSFDLEGGMPNAVMSMDCDRECRPNAGARSPRGSSRRLLVSNDRLKSVLARTSATPAVEALRAITKSAATLAKDSVSRHGGHCFADNRPGRTIAEPHPSSLPISHARTNRRRTKGEDARFRF